MTHLKVLSFEVTVRRMRVALGELLSLDIETIGVADLAGKYETDSTLRSTCEEGYRAREAEHDSSSRSTRRRA